MFNSIMINLFGSDKEVEIASHEIAQVCNGNGLLTKIISIQPTCLSCQTTNTIPKWRIQIEKELGQNHEIIINKVGHANCDEITDMCRSIRALSYTTHPYALKVESDVKTIDEKIRILNTCDQLNMVYSIKSDVQTKIEDINRLIK